MASMMVDLPLPVGPKMPKTLPLHSEAKSIVCSSLKLFKP